MHLSSGFGLRKTDQATYTRLESEVPRTYKWQSDYNADLDKSVDEVESAVCQLVIARANLALATTSERMLHRYSQVAAAVAKLRRLIDTIHSLPFDCERPQPEDFDKTE